MSANDPLLDQTGMDDLFLPDDYTPEIAASADVAVVKDLEPLVVDTAVKTPSDTFQPSEKIATAEVDPSAADPEAFAVPDNLDWNDVMAEFDALSRTMAVATGRLDSLREREAVRVLEVSEAKGRKIFRPQVEDVLQKLQNEAHERSVGAFERMLTAIAQDVQPISNISIKLKLTTERNMPALEIYGEVRREPKEGEKVEDYVKREELTSGALANVVSTGLRFITLARSGNRRFLVLDEADCWIENKDVQNFFNVVNQLSREAGIQTVIITHHDLSAFEDDFRIYKIHEVASKDEWKRRTPELVSQGKMEPTEMQHDVLSFVEAKNFEAYTDAHIDLAPGVTAITGINRGSKSAWARMFRAAFLGDCTDSNIRHGQNATKVAVGFSDGRVLEYNRRKKATPIADYIMHTPESWDFSRDNPTWEKNANAPKPYHHSPVAKVPQWLPVETGVGLIDNVDVQLWPQFNPVFMLDETPSKRASLLSMGRESGYLFAMTEINKEDINSDNKLMTEGEKEIFKLRANIEPYAELPALKAKFDELSANLSELVVEDRWIANGMSIINSLEQNAIERAHFAQWKGLENLLPKEPAILATEAHSTWLERVEEAKDMQSSRTELSVPAYPEIMATALLEDLFVGMATAKADAKMKGLIPSMVQFPLIESTSDLSGMVVELAAAGESASLKGQIPEAPKLPQIEPTQAAQDLVERLSIASVDRNLPILTMPSMMPIKRTEKLEQWAVEVDRANEDRNRPRIELLTPPDLENTQDPSNILSDLQKAMAYLNGCRAQSSLLNEQFAGVQRVLEKASKALGFNAFELPADVAQALAEGAVLSYEKGGSRDKVVAYFETIKDQIQLAARKGYLHAMESNLNLPSGTLEQSMTESPTDQPAAIRSHRP